MNRTVKQKINRLRKQISLLEKVQTEVVTRFDLEYEERVDLLGELMQLIDNCHNSVEFSLTAYKLALIARVKQLEYYL